MIGSAEVAEGREGARTSEPPTGSQRTLESKSEVGKSVWRKGSATNSERVERDSAEIEPFVDRQKKSKGGIGKSGVAEGRKCVELRGQGAA